MKLKSIGVINWANLPNRNYELNQVTLVTGESGAGKTTLLDAIQTILTAATAGLYQYNPGQEEATQQSRTKETRTLASYFLGCDDGAYSRPDGAHGYILANWVPETGEAAGPFCALIGCTAYLDTAGKRRAAKEEELCFGLVRGECLSVDHFQTTDSTGDQHIIAPKELMDHFKKVLPTHTLEVARGKEDYLCRLYGAFRGRNSVNKLEARSAAKALSKFMVYKKLDNLNEFVRREILEPHDLSDAIRQVSSMMRTISEMEQEAQGIEKGISFLDEANKQVEAFIQTSVGDQLSSYEKLLRNSAQLTQKHQECEKKTRQFNRDIKHLMDEQVHLTQRLDQVSDQLRDLEMQRHGYGVLAQKDRLEKELQVLEKEQTTLVQNLLTANQQRHANREIASQLQPSEDVAQRLFGSPDELTSWDRQLSQVIANDPWHRLPITQLLSSGKLDELIESQTQIARIDKAHNRLVKHLTERGSHLNQLFYQARENLAKLTEQKKDLEAQIAQMETTNQVPYPYEVKRALMLICENFPNANPQVLCDHTEVKDDTWQVAVEGLLGYNRFLIMVDPEFESRAMRLIKTQGLSKSAIVQGRKAVNDTRNKTVSADCLVSLLRFDHHSAESYFKAAYGNVRLVEDVETLRKTPRGLMKNGMASASYKMFIVATAEAELVFGRAARQRSVKAKRQQLQHLDHQLEQAQSLYQTLSHWQSAASQMAPLDLTGALNAIVHSETLRSDLISQLNGLDLSQFKEIEELIQNVKSKQMRLFKKNDQINRQIGSNENEIRAMASRMEQLILQREEKDRQAQAHLDILHQYTNQWPDLAITEKIAAIPQFDGVTEPLYKSAGENVGARLNHQVSIAERNLERFNEMRLRGTTINYSHFLEQRFLQHHHSEQLVTSFGLACDLARQIHSALNFLRNDILAKHKEKLTDMTQRFNTTFVSHLCHGLSNAVRNGKAKLDALNRKLRDHYFGEEYYRFEYRWIPEFYEYNKFFQEAVLLNSSTGISLFGQNELSTESQRIFTEICNKLLDPDVERSIEDLKRIADYRNYRTYDIKKCLPDRELSLKTYGSGSGGQMETPSYVIRSAGLSSALRFGEGHSHLKTVLIDESFSKMDEQRCRAVIDYLSHKLGLQIIFVVPTMKAGALHDHVDQVVQVTKLAAELPRGELKTTVMVTTNQLKKERVVELWEQERLNIETRAHQLNFLELLDA